MKRNGKLPSLLEPGLTLSKICLLFPAVILAFVLAGCGKSEEAKPGPPLVEVLDVIQKDVPVYAEWVGTTDGLVNATIRAQVQGYLIKQRYHEGDFVKKGQVLFEIDPRPFQAALNQAQADLARSDALWQTAKANLARVKPLAEQNAVSKKDLDDHVGSELSARAQVQASQASVEKAQLNLGFTKVVSLIDGIAGIAKAQVGDLVGPGALEELTVVSTVDPIKVYINISEQEYLKAASMKDEDFAKVPLDLVLADGSTFPSKGRFIIADRQIDVKTGTIKVAGLFKNPGGLLRPGQFCKVRAMVYTKKSALLVPQRSVTELQGSYQVAVVGPDNKVEIRPVKVSERVGTLWVIDQGLKPGERVVAEGVQKVRQGMTVNARPFDPGVKAKPEAPSKPEAKAAEPATKAAPDKR